MISEIDSTNFLVAKRIVEIQLAAYAVEAKLIGFDGIPQLVESTADVQNLDPMTWLGAFGEGKLVGVVAWVASDSLVDITRLAVDPLAARRGHGRRLVRSVPADRRTVVSTGKMNTPAVALYQSEGFETVEETEVAPGVTIAHFERPGST